MQIKFDNDCLTLFNDLKFRKSDIRYIIYSINNEGGEIIKIEKVARRQQTWEDLINNLPHNQYRYAVFDAEFINDDKMNISKIIFIFWSPDEAPMKGKMVYATAKQNFKKSLNISKDYVICSKQQFTFHQLVKQLSK